MNEAYSRLGALTFIVNAVPGLAPMIPTIIKDVEDAEVLSVGVKCLFYHKTPIRKNKFWLSDRRFQPPRETKHPRAVAQSIFDHLFKHKEGLAMVNKVGTTVLMDVIVANLEDLTGLFWIFVKYTCLHNVSMVEIEGSTSKASN